MCIPQLPSWLRLLRTVKSLWGWGAMGAVLWRDSLRVRWHWGGVSLDRRLALVCFFWAFEEVKEDVEKDMARLALSYLLGRWLETTWFTVLSTKSFTPVQQLLLEGALSPCAQLLDSKNLTAAWDSVQLAIDHQLDEIQAHRARYISATPAGCKMRLLPP